MKKTTKHILSFALVLGVMSVPFLAGAQFNSEAGAGGTGLSTDTLTNTLINILNIFLALVALLAVLGMVIAGFMFITAGGSNERLESAKGWLTWSIVGVAVALIGYIVINFVASLFQAG
jgi:cytochrome bd-type quinol oxidase subunit 2